MDFVKGLEIPLPMQSLLRVVQKLVLLTSK